MPASMKSTRARLKDGHTEPVRNIVDSYELIESLFQKGYHATLFRFASL